MSVTTRVANGDLGYLALVIPEAEFLTHSGGVAYIVPTSPPEAPVHPAQATSAQITEINRRFLQDQKTFDTYCEVSRALRSQVIAAVPDMFLSDIKHAKLGYANVTCLELLTHLWANYGAIQPHELVENRIRMATPWTFPEPIETLFTQLKNGMEFSVDGGNPVNEVTAMMDGYITIESNPEFVLATGDWRKKTPAEQTMIAFKAFFRKADTDLRHTIMRPSARTTGQAGYHGSANLVYEAQVFTAALKAAPTQALGAANLTVPVVKKVASYCWTHGVMPKGGHNSANCKSRDTEPGHQVGVTLANKMGGCTKMFVLYYKCTPTEE